MAARTLQSDSDIVRVADLSPHPLFDRRWYADQYPEDARNGLTLQHFLTTGWRELKSPHPLFSTRYYLESNPDIQLAKVDPLTHFVTIGWKEGRAPHPLFDVEFYCSHSKAIRSNGIDPLSHYLVVGWRLGYWPNKLFDPEWYLSQYEDVVRCAKEPLTHYVEAGWLEGRRPTQWFDPDAYRARHNIEAEVEPLSHFARSSHSTPASIGASQSVDLTQWRIDLNLDDADVPSLERPIGIFVHLFYDGLADEIASYIARIDLPKTVYVSTSSEDKKKAIIRAFGRYDLGPVVQVFVVPNIGFDIAPLLVEFKDVMSRHDICLKLHGKRSLHNSAEFGERWRAHLFRELVGDADRTRSIVNTMLRNPELGILLASHWPSLEGWIGIGQNFVTMKGLLGRIDVELLPNQTIEYPSGSMFWFKPEALSTLAQLNLRWADFDSTAAQRDATLAHAIERSFLFFAADANKRWAFLPSPTTDKLPSRAQSMSLIYESGLFDNEYYLEENPDVRGIDPIEHWFDWGCAEGRQPSRDFNPKYYARVAGLDHSVNPLIHYIMTGRRQGLATKRPARVSATVEVDDLYSAYIRAERSPDYVRETAPIIRTSDVRLIAFYFPQFHPFPENDKFWGRGFTEWTNTTKATQMFKHHYQPRLPGELGFYDTRVKAVLARQIELAKQYGVYGFCFHHYFFEEKPVMRVPYNTMLSEPDLDIPFCLHWANEPWTVRWDGLATKKGMLLNQRHDAHSDLAFFRDIEPAISDPRYITVGGRPLIIIYRPGLFPDMKATIERWRDSFRRAGLQDPYLAVMQTPFDGAVDPRIYGFDAAIEYPPHNFGPANVTNRIELFDPGFEGNIYDYEHLLEKALARPAEEYRLFRGIIPDWDCTPRRANPDLFINAEPHRYKRWLRELCGSIDDDRPSDEKLIFINAWNEWAEGAYLEPDRRYGYAYLDATASALNSYRQPSIDECGLRILIGAHIFYTDLLEEFNAHFSNIPGVFDLFITTSSDKKDNVQSYLKMNGSKNIRRLTVVGVDNIGRDFAPFIFKFLPAAADYDLTCWVHSKKSLYDTSYGGWRKYLLTNLLGAPENIRAIVDAFARSAKLGVVYPKAFPPVADKIEWGSNFKLTSALLKRLGIAVSEAEDPVFPTAAMFWFRPAALRGLGDLKLTVEDFKRHADGPRDAKSDFIIDGTISHALERMILYISEASGYHSREILFEAAA